MSEAGESCTAILGAGSVGGRLGRELAIGDDRDVLVYSRRGEGLGRSSARPRVSRIACDTFTQAINEMDDSVSTLVFAGETGGQAELARAALLSGKNVVSPSDDPDEVRDLLRLHELAADRRLSLVVGAAFSPGLTCLLSSLGSRRFDLLDEIHLARIGTGGPQCAKQRVRSTRLTTEEWRNGRWVAAASGSGRELCWFPDPIGAKDCYRVASAEPQLIVREFPALNRVSVRMAMSRKDRLALPLPHLLHSPGDGGVGACRVELRGFRGGVSATYVFGALDRPAQAAAAVLAEVVVGIECGEAPLGAHGLAAWDSPETVLSRLRQRGIRVAEFIGSAA